MAGCFNGKPEIGRLEGDRLAARELRKVAPEEIAALAQRPNWLLVESRAQGPDGGLHIPGAVVLDSDALTRDTLRKLIRDRRARNRGTDFVLAVAPRAAGQLLPASIAHSEVVRLRGGIEALEKYQQRTERIHGKKVYALQDMRSCGQ